MVLNPAGYVPIFDFGAPRIISGYARATISGGQLVYASGAAGAVSSGANSFTTNDIGFVTAASGTLFTGVAINNAASGALVSVALGGACISTVNVAVVAGQQVVCDGIDSISAPANGSAMIIGRALTGAASGGYALWNNYG